MVDRILILYSRFNLTRRERGLVLTTAHVLVCYGVGVVPGVREQPARGPRQIFVELEALRHASNSQAGIGTTISRARSAA